MKKTVYALVLSLLAVAGIGLATAGPAAAVGATLTNTTYSNAVVYYRTSTVDTVGKAIYPGGYSGALTPSLVSFKIPSGCHAETRFGNGWGGFGTLIPTSKSGLWLSFPAYSGGSNMGIIVTC